MNRTQTQTTYATLLKKEDGSYDVQVVKQKIWVEGVSYELQEIFGIENCSTGMPLDDESNGKECVVCLSEAGFASILIQHSTTRFSSLTRPYSRYKPRHCFSKPLSPLATSAPSLNRPAACVRACVHL